MRDIQGTVGPTGTRADGSRIDDLRFDKTLAQVVTDAHGRYFEAASRPGRVFAASLQAGTALGTALTLTAVTLTLWNPAGSGVLVSILSAGVAITTAPAGSAALVYAVNFNPIGAAPATVTALASGSRAMPLGSEVVPVAKVYSAATLPAAPVAARVLATVLATGSTGVGYFRDDVAGAIVLAPNSCVTIQNIGTAMSGIVDIMWEEIPIA